MDRITMINTIGNSYCTSNLENGEFSYYKALNEAGVLNQYLMKMAEHLKIWIFVLSKIM